MVFLLVTHNIAHKGLSQLIPPQTPPLAGGVLDNRVPAGLHEVAMYNHSALRSGINMMAMPTRKIMAAKA